MTYTYTDAEGDLAALYGLGLNGVRITTASGAVDISQADAPEVCRQILAYAGRSDVEITERDDVLAPEEPADGTGLSIMATGIARQVNGDLRTEARELRVDNLRLAAEVAVLERVIDRLAAAAGGGRHA